MDLCGTMRIESINGKKYILVIVDDYSRFTWVKFLRSKDETPDFIIKLLKMIQVPLNASVINIRMDNRTEFVNQTLKTYYEDVGISHQTLVFSLVLADMISLTSSCEHDVVIFDFRLELVPLSLTFGYEHVAMNLTRPRPAAATIGNTCRFRISQVTYRRACLMLALEGFPSSL
ncbi:putative ribonuclease H-like domain-containing protein [Tanacetum coccineum]